MAGGYNEAAPQGDGMAAAAHLTTLQPNLTAPFNGSAQCPSPINAFGWSPVAEHCSQGPAEQL